MKIVVCVKQVLDPEVPPRAFRVDEATGRPQVIGMPAVQVMDSYAENALELGIQLRDRVAGSTLTALCLGDENSDEVLRRAFSFTADAAARVWEPGWVEFDGLAVAHVLARAITALGGADLVLCGRQAADIEESVVGPALAEELGCACVTLALDVEPADGAVVVRRDADGRLETVRAPLPAVVSVTSSDGNVPRMPRVKDVMLARRKPIRVLGPDDLDLDPARSRSTTRIARMYVPAARSHCEMLHGSDGQEQARALLSRLEELKVV